MSTETRRLTILSAEEIAALYELPKFNDDDRQLYFDFSAAERDAVERVHTSSAAVHLALQMALFKAKRRFFVFEPNSVAVAVADVVKRHFAGKEIRIEDCQDRCGAAGQAGRQLGRVWRMLIDCLQCMFSQRDKLLHRAIGI